MLVEEKDRSLTEKEVGDVLDLPVLARVPVKMAIFHAVDAGVLAARLPEPIRATGVGARAPGRPRVGTPGSGGMTTITVVDDVTLKQRVQRRLIEGIDHATGTPDELRAMLRELLRDEEPLLATARFERVLSELVDEVGGLGPLEPFLADASITEVMVNGPGRAYVERNGRLEPVALDLDAAAIVRLVERVVAPLGLRLDRASPMVDARLPDGSRLHAVIPPLAVDGPCVTIRRFGARAVPLDAFGLGAHAAAFLEWVVGAGWNVLVAGGTSAGKTTLLNALSAGDPVGGADRHHRGDGGASARATTRCAPRSASGERGGRGRGERALAGSRGAPDAPRPRRGR